MEDWENVTQLTGEERRHPRDGQCSLRSPWPPSICAQREETEGPLLKTQNEAVLVSKAFSFSRHLALELSSCFHLLFDISPSKGDLEMFIFGTDFTLRLYVVQR